MSKSLRVLIVEDSVDDTDLLVRELRRSGYDPLYERVEDAPAMKAALTQQTWDIVLSDYTLPRFSAPAALSLLQKSGIDLPFIIISGTVGEDTAVAALKAGANDFLVKGQLTRLAPAIERELKDAQVRQERRAAERALHDQEHYFQVLIENVSDVIITLDETGQITYASPALTRILGYMPAEHIGLNVVDLLHPDDVQENAAQFSQLLQQPGGSGVTQFRAQRKNGSWCWLEATSRNLLAEPGVNAVVTVLRDITERKRAETEREQLLAQIRSQAQEVQFIVDTVPEAIFLLSEDCHVKLTNPTAAEYLTLLSPGWEDGRIQQIGQYSLVQLLTSPPKGLWHEVNHDGRHFEAIARPVEFSPQHQGWVFVLRDVTREREIQRQVQSQERLAAVGQLAAGIAHDFNNSLAVIKLYTDVLQRTAELSPRNQERMQTVSQQTQRAADLIQQILDFSRQSLIERQPLDLLPFLKELTKLLKRTMPENVQVRLDAEKDEFIIHADPSRIQQVILNLAFNVRDAMPQGGHMTLSLNTVQFIANDAFPVPGMTPGTWVQVGVADTGTGIPAEMLAHIFEPFFTTKARDKGTGLGLAQVYGIVQQHDGFIDVRTEEAQGTTFFLYFPSWAEGEAVALSPDTTELQYGQGQKILLVEDDPATRQAVADGLTLLNYEVIEAVNGREALSILETKADEISLVLSDAVMPELGGIALLHAMRQQNLTIPVILLTGHPLNTLRKKVEDLQSLGLNGLLPKPPNLEELSHLLARVLPG